MSKSIIIYDATALPSGLAFDEVINHCREHKVLVWDSSQGGKEPRIIECEDGKEFDIQEIKDVSKKA